MEGYLTQDMKALGIQLTAKIPTGGLTRKTATLSGGEGNPGLKGETWGTQIAGESDVGHPPLLAAAADSS